MRKEILDALKTKFAGVSETILGGIADKLAASASTAGDVRTVVDGVTFQQVLESYGDSRATGATKTAVLNYEKKYGLKDGEKVRVTGDDTSKKDPDKDAGVGGADVPEWARSLIEGQRKLEERLTAQDRERESASRKQRLSAVIGRLPENLRKGYERTAVDGLKEEEFQALLADISGEVDGIVKSDRQRGAAFRIPVGGGKRGNADGGPSPTASDAEVKDLLKHLAV